MEILDASEQEKEDRQFIKDQILDFFGDEYQEDDVLIDHTYFLYLQIKEQEFNSVFQTSIKHMREALQLLKGKNMEFKFSTWLNLFVIAVKLKANREGKSFAQIMGEI